ncbi:hypothetical protein EI94DRAFT_712282 [Lactarius quietus]|nr:hypothetical protein EI94DRAFT_712282 [Lactarius quietus]
MMKSLTVFQFPSVIPASYDKALELLAAAQKYDMVSVQSTVHTEIKSRGPVVLTGAVAYRAYTISCGAKLLPEMETLACLTLDFPMTLKYLSDELLLFKGYALRDLVRYCKHCQDGLVSILQSFLDSTAAPSNIWVVCTSSRGDGDDYFSRKRAKVLLTAVFPEWLRQVFSQCIQKLQETLSDPLLKPSSIHGAYITALKAHINMTNCDPCSKVHTLKGDIFCGELESKLAQALDKVSASSQ